jgi:predicted SnoaL-like aldol condensation-catalyzing enzyme
MSNDVQNNMQVLRHWYETVQKGDFIKMKNEWADICTDGYTLHDPSTPDLKPGKANFMEFFDQAFKNMSDIRLKIEEIFGGGDKVVSQGIFEWVEGKPPEKKKMMGIIISRFEDGKVAEEWQVMAPFAAPAK